MTTDVSELLHDKSVSGWLKEALTSALTRDPVDAANDAAILAELLQKHADHTLLESAKALGLTPKIPNSPLPAISALN